MDLEKRLYEALKHHKTNSIAHKPDLFKEPSVGNIRETESGPLWCLETVYDEGYLHGRIELSCNIPRSAVEFLDSTTAILVCSLINHILLIDVFPRQF